MQDLTYAQIDFDALVHNCKVLKKAAGKRKLFTVVKADGYGHGMLQVATAVAKQVAGYCVFEIKDAVKLRSHDLEHPILIMQGVDTKAEIKTCIEYALWPVISDLRQLALITKQKTKLAKVFIKLQTGMNRLGFELAKADIAIATLQKLGYTNNIELFQHFANADVETGTFAQNLQMINFVQKHKLAFTSSNSAATLFSKNQAEHFVRCGIALYGSSPAPKIKTAKQLKLKAVMTLKSKVLAIRAVKADEAIGYGSRYRCPKKTNVAVVACGYAKGYPRIAPDGTPVWIKQTRCKLIGRVSMEMLTVDIAKLDVKVGDEVELWGNNISVDEIAQKCGTIGYELLSSLTSQIKRYAKKK